MSFECLRHAFSAICCTLAACVGSICTRRRCVVGGKKLVLDAVHPKLPLAVFALLVTTCQLDCLTLRHRGGATFGTGGECLGASVLSDLVSAQAKSLHLLWANMGLFVNGVLVYSPRYGHDFGLERMSSPLFDRSGERCVFLARLVVGLLGPWCRVGLCAQTWRTNTNSCACHCSGPLQSSSAFAHTSLLGTVAQSCCPAATRMALP